MLLEFRAKNYKSFKEELVFSMIPAPKQKGLDFSILRNKVGAKEYRGLCAAVLYGPNAAGKTNIIGAMEVFKSIVLRGHIRNDEKRNTPNAAAYMLELIPNNTLQNSKAVDFSLKFIENDLLFEYAISLDMGGFLQTDYRRKIISESLYINEKLIFGRNNDLEFGDFRVIHKYLVNTFNDNKQGIMDLAKNNLNDEELFLMNGFKAMFSSKIVGIITSWLNQKFTVIYRADSLYVTKKIPDSKKQTNAIYVDKMTNEAAKIFGINSNAIGYVTPEDDSEAKLCSVFKDKKVNKVIPAEMFESYGTIRFINIFPLIVDALMNGGILVVDEFDASIHPMALMNIINIFHNDDINKNNAQLIFNTHNPIFLNSNLFRRDEIKFVERDEQTNCSTHYSLSDFGTAGSQAVRKNDDYMKNYFVSQYGAIRDIDFTAIFDELLHVGRVEV